MGRRGQGTRGDLRLHPANRASGRMMKRMIAVVDDDLDLLDSLENLLESTGYSVRTFSSARALIDAGLTGIDCLITDIGMPEMDGFDRSEERRVGKEWIALWA